MHFLVISKFPVFTDEGEIIPGQCEPDTPGWRLRLFEDGTESILMEGTYLLLRRVQKMAFGKTVAETRLIATEAENDALGTASDETREATEILDYSDVRQAMLGLDLSAVLGESSENLDWFELDEQDGITLATLNKAQESVTASLIALTLKTVSSHIDTPLVIDLATTERDATEVSEILSGVVTEAVERNQFIGLIGVSDDLKSALENKLSRSDGLVFPDFASAAEVVKAEVAGSDIETDADDLSDETDAAEITEAADIE